MLRLRTFLPLLAAATSKGDAAGAFAVYDDMRTADIIVRASVNRSFFSVSMLMFLLLKACLWGVNLSCSSHMRVRVLAFDPCMIIILCPGGRARVRASTERCHQSSGCYSSATSADGDGRRRLEAVSAAHVAGSRGLAHLSCSPGPLATPRPRTLGLPSETINPILR